MAVDTATLLTIDGTVIPNIKRYTVKYAKLWSNAGRNMAGSLRATLIGVFPKIVVEFAPMGEDDLATIASLLNKSSFTAQFYDPDTKQVQTGTFYASDFDTSVLKKSGNIYDAFQVSLISYNKATWSM